MIYTTVHTAYSATLLTMLKDNDCAIVDMTVYASVYEELYQTNIKKVFS